MMAQAEKTPPSRDAVPATSGPLALEVKGLTKRFPGVLALDDVSLAVKPGEVHALVGQNGAGKSTLINILSGMYAADAGRIAIGGAPVEIGSTHQALSLGIATVYQELSLLLNLTVAQNLALGREPKRFGLLDVAAMHTNGTAVLARLGLDIDPDARVSSLPLAQRQMIEIAKALSTEPKILILDEPTAPLGPREAKQLFNAIDRLKSQGVATLYVSHRFAEILDLCETAAVLRNGKCVASVELAGWSEARLTETMIGRQAQRYEASRRDAGEVFVRAAGIGWGRSVRDANFTAHRGEILALTGLLGGGQNEIARLIGGDLRADAGTIEVAGTPCSFHSPHDAVAAGICLLTEDRKHEAILPNLPVRENIAVASLAARAGFGGAIRTGDERHSTQHAADDFGVVAASPEAPIRTLSGGNQQKALLARWHLADAEMFVLIEPTRGVDVGARADIYRRLDALAKAGKAIVVVSSDLAEVLALADRILVVRDGKISSETTPQQVDEERLNLLVQGAALS
jgi:ABC-type sugar transport system ATPase subunit